jgi:hypothetical protein
MYPNGSDLPFGSVLEPHVDSWLFPCSVPNMTYTYFFGLELHAASCWQRILSIFNPKIELWNRFLITLQISKYKLLEQLYIPETSTSDYIAVVVIFTTNVVISVSILSRQFVIRNFGVANLIASCIV